ncbi:MAG: DUF2934 domain-containing protein [Candidatus Thiodiazotropha sp.]
MSKTEANITKKKAASKKKVVKKKVAAKPTTKKKVSKKKTVAASKGSQALNPRARYEMIATMAFYRAEQRNFAPGHDVEDWLDCERIIDEMMSK